MKCRVIKPFVDALDKNVIHSVGEELDLDKNRVEFATAYGYVAIEEEPKEKTKRSK